MNFRRRPRITSEVSTSSLNDIMFFLLLFFLITSTMINPNMIKLSLPKATNKVMENNKNVTVSIDSVGNYLVNKKKIDLDRLPSAIQVELNKLKLVDKDPVLIVNADKSVKWDNVVKVIVIGKKFNARVLAATQDE